VVRKSVVGLLSIWATLWKMKLRRTFHISRKPIVPLAKVEHLRDLDNGFEAARFDGPPGLVAIARGPWTLLAYWNIDWVSIFKNAVPIDRHVHLRIYGGESLEEKEATIEPMVGMHHLTLSQRHRTCRVEIGYYQPADVWNSVAMSNEVIMPPGEVSESEDVDIATIPFHLSFQQLIDLYGANNETLATVIARFQTRATSRRRYGTLTSEERKILQRSGQTLSELTDSRRIFNQIDNEKLKKHAKSLLGSGATSPLQGFRRDWTSGGP